MTSPCDPISSILVGKVVLSSEHIPDLCSMAHSCNHEATNSKLASEAESRSSGRTGNSPAKGLATGGQSTHSIAIMRSEL